MVTSLKPLLAVSVPETSSLGPEFSDLCAHAFWLTHSLSSHTSGPGTPSWPGPSVPATFSH